MAISAERRDGLVSNHQTERTSLRKLRRIAGNWTVPPRVEVDGPNGWAPALTSDGSGYDVIVIGAGPPMAS
jgi:hypothetical protein